MSNHQCFQPAWLRWLTRATWLALTVNVAAVYAITLSRGQWPRSHPYSGLTMVFAALYFGTMDWNFTHNSAGRRHPAALKVLLPLSSILILLAAVAMFMANRVQN
jgi:hypothetical protein